jgi:hypothetical protein
MHFSYGLFRPYGFIIWAVARTFLPTNVVCVCVCVCVYMRIYTYSCQKRPSIVSKETPMHIYT